LALGVARKIAKTKHSKLITLLLKQQKHVLNQQTPI
jgi:hypothetical protein